MTNNGETWLICGGRDFTDPSAFIAGINPLVLERGCPAKVVHGDQHGADKLADVWGRFVGAEVVAVPADWTRFGGGAGPIRNRQMLDEHRPVLVVAFPGAKGTADMCEYARSRGVEVVEVLAEVRV